MDIIGVPGIDKNKFVRERMSCELESRRRTRNADLTCRVFRKDATAFCTNCQRYFSLWEKEYEFERHERLFYCSARCAISRFQKKKKMSCEEEPRTSQ